MFEEEFLPILQSGRITNRVVTILGSARTIAELELMLYQLPSNRQLMPWDMGKLKQVWRALRADWDNAKFWLMEDRESGSQIYNLRGEKFPFTYYLPIIIKKGCQPKKEGELCINFPSKDGSAVYRTTSHCGSQLGDGPSNHVFLETSNNGTFWVNLYVDINELTRKRVRKILELLDSEKGGVFLSHYEGFGGAKVFCLHFQIKSPEAEKLQATLTESDTPCQFVTQKTLDLVVDELNQRYSMDICSIDLYQ